jgi:sn-glycerol 3-phosphate transport system permease protein
MTATDIIPDWLDKALFVAGAWILALLWILPLAWAVWAAIHPAQFVTGFDPLAPLTLQNFVDAWNAAPFGRYLLNTVILVTMILTAQLLLCIHAAFAFARLCFPFKNLLFALVLMQLMITPDILLVRNYATLARFDLLDTILAIGLPYFASAFAMFLLRQTFKTVPIELDEAARIEGINTLGLIWRVYVPLAKPTILAFALVSVSTHWNNFVWPLIVTSSVETRPLTVGLSIFATTDSGVEWSIITAATLITSGPLLLGFLLFQRQFMQSFMRAGIK